MNGKTEQPGVAFQKCRHNSYLWADGIHFNLRLDEGLLCLLVLRGATHEGNKELVAVCGGYRESTESWLEVLRDLKERNMPSPNLRIGDGDPGFWKAIPEVYPEAGHQRCRVHKTAPWQPLWQWSSSLPRAQKRWRRLRGYKLILMVINGVKSIDKTEKTLAA